MVEESVLTVAKHWSIKLGCDLSDLACEVERWDDVKVPIKLHVDVSKGPLTNGGKKTQMWADLLELIGRISMLKHLSINAFFTNSGKRALPLSLMPKILMDSPALESLQLDQVGFYCDGDPQHIFQRLSDSFLSHKCLRIAHIHRLCFPSRLSRNHAVTMSHATLRQLCSHLVTALLRCSTIQSFILEAPSIDPMFRLDLNEEAQVSIFDHQSLRSVRLHHALFLASNAPERQKVSFDNNISSLCLNNCILSENCCLSQFLRRNFTLQVLDLSGSSVQYDMAGICSILEEKSGITHLTFAHALLDHTEAMQHKCLLQAVKSCRGHPKLEYLDIRGFYDYHYNDEDLSRPIELFLSLVEAVIGLAKSNPSLKTVLLDDIEHSSLTEPLSALSLHLKLNNGSGAATADSLQRTSRQDDLPTLLFNRYELGYLYHCVKRNPTSLRIDTKNI